MKLFLAIFFSILYYSTHAQPVPDNCSDILRRAIKERRGENFGDAMKDINYCIIECKDTSFSSFYCRGKIFQGIKEYDKTIADFQIALMDTVAFDMTVSDCFFQIGFCYAELHLNNQAIEWYTKSIDIDKSKQNADCFYNRALAYHYNGNTRQACEDLNVAISFGLQEAQRTKAAICK